jgi:hypothetical protein
MEVMMKAITDAFMKVGTPQAQPPNAQVDRFIVRRSHKTDLSLLNGETDDWPVFIATFHRSTKTCGFNDEENLMRLQRCLRGEAEKAVKCLLVSPNNLPETLSTLETRFEKTQHIIDALVVKMMAIPPVRADRLEPIVELGTAVTSLVSTIKTLKADSHLNNPHLVTEIDRKLTPSMRLAWAEWVHADVVRKKDLGNMAYWMKKKTAAICEICPPTVKDKKPEGKGRGRAFAVTEQPKKTEKKRRKIYNKVNNNCCGGEGHLACTCHVMKKMNLDDRWKMVTEKKLCFSCLRTGNPTAACRTKRKCRLDERSFTHYRLRHGEKTNNPKPFVPPVPEPESSAFVSSSPKVLLHILPVTVVGARREVDTFALCDEGAILTMIDDKLAAQVGATGPTVPLCVSFMKKGTTYDKSQTLSIRVRGQGRRATIHTMNNVRTVEGLNLPSQSIKMKSLYSRNPHLRGLQLPHMDNAKQLIIGSDNLKLTTPRQVVLREELLQPNGCWDGE